MAHPNSISDTPRRRSGTVRSELRNPTTRGDLPIETENPTTPHDSDYRIDLGEFGEFAARLIAQAHVMRRSSR
jgi:hypothetical protein